MWDSHNSVPRDVRFTGVGIGTRSVRDAMDIQLEWGTLDETAYTKANRDKYRKGEKRTGNSTVR
jgi:hypothetical protein